MRTVTNGRLATTCVLAAALAFAAVWSPVAASAAEASGADVADCREVDLVSPADAGSPDPYWYRRGTFVVVDGLDTGAWAGWSGTLAFVNNESLHDNTVVVDVDGAPAMAPDGSGGQWPAAYETGSSWESAPFLVGDTLTVTITVPDVSSIDGAVRFCAVPQPVAEPTPQPSPSPDTEPSPSPEPSSEEPSAEESTGDESSEPATEPPVEPTPGPSDVQSDTVTPTPAPSPTASEQATPASTPTPVLVVDTASDAPTELADTGVTLIVMLLASMAGMLAGVAVLRRTR